VIVVRGPFSVGPSEFVAGSQILGGHENLSVLPSGGDVSRGRFRGNHSQVAAMCMDDSETNHVLVVMWLCRVEI